MLQHWEFSVSVVLLVVTSVLVVITLPLSTIHGAPTPSHNQDPGSHVTVSPSNVQLPDSANVDPGRAETIPQCNPLVPSDNGTSVEQDNQRQASPEFYRFDIGEAQAHSFHGSVGNLPGVEHVYVMNLERRLDRRLRMAHMLSFLGIPFQVFSATDGVYLQRLVDEQRTIEFESGINVNLTEQMSQHPPESMGGMACLITALRIMRDIMHHNWTALVLEDDVDIELEIRSSMAEIMIHAPPTWKALRLGHCYEEQGESIWGPIYKSTSFLCPHATIYKPETAAFILKNLDISSWGWANWDQLLTTLLKDNRNSEVFESYSIFPALVVQTDRTTGDIPSSASKWQNTLQSSSTSKLAGFVLH
ncbi:collagen beta-1,O-galactosyltransferase [Pelomyxa schiedti]|nr:collagen beta-1,O-galactosyltransferase [Pelomyxa schiedti]